MAATDSLPMGMRSIMKPSVRAKAGCLPSSWKRRRVARSWSAVGLIS